MVYGAMKRQGRPLQNSLHVFVKVKLQLDGTLPGTNDAIYAEKAQLSFCIKCLPTCFTGSYYRVPTLVAYFSHT